MALEQELATYQKSLEGWSDQEGKYVLIHKSEAVDFFCSHEDALKAGYGRFGLEPFLVKLVQAIEQTHFISRLHAPFIRASNVLPEFDHADVRG